MPETVSLGVLILYLGLLVVAAFIDVLTFRIPNWLTAGVALAFGLFAAAGGLSMDALPSHLAAGAAVFAAGAILFTRGVCGGGDVKLLAAAALWAGVDGVWQLLLVTALAGGALAAALLFGRYLPIDNLSGLKPWMRRLLSPNEGVPYGVAIAAAAVVVAGRHPLLEQLL